jgi:L-arabinonolactonase
MTSATSLSVFAATNDHTGERPYWDGATSRFYWIDVFGKRFHRTDAEGTKIETFALPAFVGSLALIDDSHAILALHHGFFKYHFASGKAELICYPEENVAGNMRLNDGKIDQMGRFVCGGADFFRSKPIGGIYSLDGKFQVRRIGGGVTLFNGLCWSPDGKTMYYSDSARRQTYRCSYDPRTGEAGAPEPFILFTEADGLPDGAAVDDTGHIWIAMVYGGQLIRVSPGGQIERRVALPIRGPTSLAFGGHDYSRLFITSKSRDSQGQPLSVEAGGGSVFCLDGLPSKGLAEGRFRTDD